jgi:hypothetical protein
MVDILMMTKQPRMTPEAIKRLAVKCRKLIRESDRSQWGPQFRDFPGACGDVSEMFGTYLFERCGVNAKYVSSVEGTGFDGTHAWLELGDLIIDLTCDQFPQDLLPAPYVEKDRAWHSRWVVDRKSSINELSEGEDWGRSWRRAYEDLLEQLEQHKPAPKE